MTKAARNLQTLYAVTGIGSTFTAVASFLNLEATFQSLGFLGTALAAKTLFGAFFSYIVGRILGRVTAYQITQTAQWLGLAILGVLALGFELKSQALVLTGIVLTSAPSIALQVFVNIGNKHLSVDDQEFRRLQGTTQMIGSVGFLLACLISPLLLGRYSIGFVLALDAFTFAFAIWYLTVRRHQLGLGPRRDIEKPDQTESAFQSGLGVYVGFGLLVFATYILKGLPPVVAGSHLTREILNTDSVARSLLWTTEAAAGIFSGIAYRKFGIKFKSFRSVLVLNTLAFTPVYLAPSLTTMAIALFALSTLMTLGFMLFRDDLLQSSNNELELKKSTSFSLICANVMMTISPLFCTIVAGWIGFFDFLLLSFGLQLLTLLAIRRF